MPNRAHEFDAIADEVFAPLYPVVAEQILKITGKESGTCLDIGCGGGHLGLEIARMADMRLILADISADAINLARKRVGSWGFSSIAEALVAGVHSLPFADGSFDLIVSRSSVWFWEDHLGAFGELMRVLAPGGIIFIGSGFGKQRVKQAIIEKMRERNPEWPKKVKKRTGIDHTPQTLADTFNQLGGFTEIFQNDCGGWVICRK
jgi:ubiquinone/menaquinone biosynthesis C-methylase UbiE